MPAVKVAYAIKKAFQTLLIAAQLPGIDDDAIKIRMLPKVGEIIDTLPCLVIATYGKLEADNFATEGMRLKKYSVELCVIDALEDDTETDQETYEGWQELALATIQTDANGFARSSLSGVPTFSQLEIVDAPTFDRSKLAENYAYQSIVVRVHCIETGA